MIVVIIIIIIITIIIIILNVSFILSTPLPQRKQVKSKPDVVLAASQPLQRKINQ